jgi:ABC-2 type transport system permease protein
MTTPSSSSTSTPATGLVHHPDRESVLQAASFSVTAPAGHATVVRRAVLSELIKVHTLRPNVWLLGVATAFLSVLGPVQVLGSVLESESTTTDSATAVSTALTGATTATLLVGVLGVLLVAGEYAPRAIRTTFMAIPRRGVVVVAKALELASLIAVTGTVAVAIAVTATLMLLTREDLSVGWGSPYVARVSVAMVWYLVGWGVLGLVAGWVTRSKLGGAALLLSVMFVLAPVLGLIPGHAGEVLVALTPSSAGAAMISTHPATTDLLGSPVSVPAFGFLLWTVYLAALTTVAAVVVSHRDA